MRLYLVRHGQTQWNVDGLAQGHTDIPLDAHGQEQARRLGIAFRGVPLDLVISSDLQRSSATAEAIVGSTGAPLDLTPVLRERSFGDWEGAPYETLWARAAEVQGQMAREKVMPPNGESIQMVWDRLDTIIHRFHAGNDRIAIVTHGGTSALLLAKLLKGSIHTARAFRFANTAITELHLRPEGLFLLVRYNDTSHLDDLPVRLGNLEGSAS